MPTVKPENQQEPQSNFQLPDNPATGEQEPVTPLTILSTKLAAPATLNPAAYLNAILGNTLMGTAVTSLNGDILQSNLAFSNITGYRQDELVNLNLANIVYHSDLLKHDEIWKKLLVTGATYVIEEIRYLSKQGETIWLRNCFSLMKEHSNDSGNIMVISVNINDEKASQQKAEEITKRFRFLADSMPQLIWTADAAGNFTYFSHTFYDYTGLKHEELKTCNWASLVFPEDREITTELWQYAVQNGEEFIIEHRLKRHDGHFIWQLSRAMAQKDSHGEIIMWLGTSSNIHRQKTVAEELEKQVAERTRDLQQANFNLAHSNHDLEQFAYIATHDLQEPLRKIRTYASWINKRHLDNLPEEAQDYMMKIENASERMSILIDDLLNYSLLLRPQEAYEITDLNYILDQALKDFAHLITKRNAVIEKTDLPNLKAVPLQIYQLFHNILSNAFKFSKEELPPVVKVKSRMITEKEIIALNLDIDLSYIEIEFNDDGIGFQQEYAEKIFSIFQRLNSRQKYPGTGIGLALCQKIVTYHHGSIYASSNGTDGASFFVVLPV